MPRGVRAMCGCEAAGTHGARVAAAAALRRRTPHAWARVRSGPRQAAVGFRVGCCMMALELTDIAVHSET